VTYRFFSSVDGSHMPPTRPVCTELVLAEETTAAQADRELELAVEIIGGSDPVLCDVGLKLQVRAPETAVAAPRIVTTGPIDDAIRTRIQWLHRRLGEPQGTFSFALGKLPWNAKTVKVTANGIDYLDGEVTESKRFGPYPSEGSRSQTIKLRRRADTNAVACAMVSNNASGVNFEYGGWSSSDYESLAIDDGSGPPACP
jgi:hypothetical protein